MLTGYIGCLSGAALGRRTSDLAVMGLIPSRGVIRHLGQLSLPSLQGSWIDYQPSLAGVMVGCVCTWRVASNIVWTCGSSGKRHPVVLK